MLRKLILPICFVCIFFYPVLSSGTEAASPKPEAFLPHTVFEFDPVLEGSKVVHEFKILNRGDADLVILKTESG